MNDGFRLEEWIDKREKPAWESQELYDAQQEAIARLRYSIRRKEDGEVSTDEY